MLQTIGFAMLALAGVLILLALILAVVWHVPSLIDELSGRKAKRQIERMRKLNLASSNFSVTDTSEFYKSMNGGDMPDRGFTSVNSSLNKMVNDPYKSVNNVSRSTENKGISQSDVEDSVTSFMEESLHSDVTVKKRYTINIIEEQTSL